MKTLQIAGRHYIMEGGKAYNVVFRPQRYRIRNEEMAEAIADMWNKATAGEDATSPINSARRIERNE